jgi:hypothetical protein
MMSDGEKDKPRLKVIRGGKGTEAQGHKGEFQKKANKCSEKKCCISCIIPNKEVQKLVMRCKSDPALALDAEMGKLLARYGLTVVQKHKKEKTP